MMECDAAIREALLKDPRVQEQLRKKGEDALRDPAVQEKIASICRERFPDVADQVASSVASWADDPEVQSRVRSYVTSTAEAAKKTLFAAPTSVLALIEQGPSGVRVLAFGGGVASALLALLYMLNVIQQIAHPVNSIIDLYQLCFSLTTMLFEANPDTINSVAILTRWYEFAIKWAPFLTTALGRGMFMTFQGTMWIHESNLTDIPAIVVGIYMVFIGGVLIALHLGVMPVHVAQSIRESAASVRGLARRTVNVVAGDGPLMASSDAQQRHPQFTGSAFSNPSSVEMQSVRGATNHEV